jgi:Ca2+-binding RTX toxin-like protein
LSLKHLRRAAPGLVAAVCLVLAPSALASTLTKDGGKVVWTADGGYQDQLRVYQSSPNQISIYTYGYEYATDNSDQITIDPSAEPDCHDAYSATATTSTAVICDNVSSFQGSALDGDDALDASGLNTIPAALYGGTGSDFVGGGSADDTIDGGADDDNPSQYTNGYYAGLQGGGGADTITGGDGNDAIWGGWGYFNSGSSTDGYYSPDGNDTISAGDGIDYVNGEDGNDNIDGGPGNDGGQSFNGGFAVKPSSSSPSTDGCGVCFGSGLVGGAGNDTINGGDGLDFIMGNSGDDTLNGGAGSDILLGDDGNDALNGGEGVDNLEGSAGADATDGGAGSDYLWEYDDQSADTDHGGSETDTLVYEDTAGPDGLALVTIDDQANDGAIQADAANNVASDVENVIVDDNNNQTPAKLIGNAGANVLQGDTGPDTIDGGAGPDRLVGNDGGDTFNSRDGYPDYVDCGSGADSVTADQFDTFEQCENVDVAQVASAYDVSQPPPPPPPAVDITPPHTTVTSRSTFTVDELLKGINVTVDCNEECQGSVRLLGVQPPGSVTFSRSNGFNTTLARTSLKYKAGKRTVRVRACEKKPGGPQSKQCLARLKKTANQRLKNHTKFSLKIYVITLDHRGNRTEKSKVVSIKRNKS